MTRDSQIQKVYTACRQAGVATLHDAEVRDLVARVMNATWFRKRLAPGYQHIQWTKEGGIEHLPARSHCTPHVTELRARAGSKRTPYRVTVRVGPGQPNAFEVLHVLVHLCRPDFMHDAEFCRALVQTVDRFLGRDAREDLKAAFRKNRVKFTVMSPEARESRSLAAKHRRTAEVVVPDLLALRDSLA